MQIPCILFVSNIVLLKPFVKLSHCRAKIRSSGLCKEIGIYFTIDTNVVRKATCQSPNGKVVKLHVRTIPSHLRVYLIFK